ncbi:C4-dicarboxylate transporter [Mycobacterium sp. SMC-4]|uniref:SLAC1 family transporter n=1 Tax=Mycobacterium sp. SMC-4 TaxID=2857059 RepID=UPI0021B2EF92|nr:C4-dicarboxylate transporter [Mycobacterium sp. SMC-4]UXA17918.1 C4-dicarboxylate transporter [Mycobacterium sp. SMC-4]
MFIRNPVRTENVNAVVGGQTVRAPQPRVSSLTRFFCHVSPSLFASVMGTGIVAALAVRFEEFWPAFRGFGTAVWLLAGLWLLILSLALAGHWILHRCEAVSIGRNAAVLPFYGTVPMAILTVGAGTLLYGDAVFGPAACWIAGLLWTLGTLLGIATAIGVPVIAVLSAHPAEDFTLPCWMLPVVPPMVSAATGAGLLEHIDSPHLRLAMLTLCYGLFGMALILALLTLAMIYNRLMRIGAPAATALPTIWIPLGVIGQSIAAANLLGVQEISLNVAGSVTSAVLQTVGIGFGVVMLGFTLFWILFAAALTAQATVIQAPFSLSWWSVVFPIGAVTLGLSALAEAANFPVLQFLSLGLYVTLVVIWLAVASRSVAGRHMAWWRTQNA